MASDYGLNFGFRVSDESYRRSNGRVKTPATGAPLLLGTAVEIDPVNPGYLRTPGTGAKPRTYTCGLLVQEEAWDRGIYEGQLVDSFLLGVAKLNRLSVITNGAGSKVWFRNTDAQTRADGRVVPAVTMFNPASVAVGRGLAWDGTNKVWIDVADPTAATAFMEVTAFEPAYGRLEAVLTH
jgi:hypothetical protein